MQSVWKLEIDHRLMHNCYKSSMVLCPNGGFLRCISCWGGRHRLETLSANPIRYWWLMWMFEPCWPTKGGWSVSSSSLYVLQHVQQRITVLSSLPWFMTWIECNSFIELSRLVRILIFIAFGVILCHLINVKYINKILGI